MSKRQNDEKSLTYDFDVVGHPGQGNSLLDKGFPGFRSKHLVAGQHDVELSQAAEEEGGQGGRQEGQVLAKPLFQQPAVIFALKYLLDKCSRNIMTYWRTRTKSGKYGPRALWSEFYMSLGSLYVPREVDLADKTRGAQRPEF